MKVAFHIDQLWFSAPGGIGTYVRELLRALPVEDPSLDLEPFHARWRRRPGEAPLTYGERPGIEIPLSIRTLYPAWDLLGRPALPGPLRGCGVVHATNPAAVPPTGHGQALVVTVHDLAFEHYPEAFPPIWRRLYRAGLRRAALRADAIITPSHATADDLRERTGVDPSRVHVTPLAGFTPADDGAPDVGLELTEHGIVPPYLLFVGTIEPRKNIVRLVRAYRRLAAEGLPHSLVLVGPAGWGAGELERELAAEGPGRIVRTGGLSRPLLDAAYRATDAFVYPSLYEGFGLPVLEALQRGAPVVASSSSSIPEIAGDAAVLVEPTDEDALTAAMRSVLTDRSLRDDLARRGPSQVAGLSWAATARATLKVYRTVVDR